MPEKGFLCGMNTPADPGNWTDSEKKHMPVKAGEPVQVKIKVGAIPHVMDEGHFIQWIEVYVGNNYYARVDLTPVFTKPEVTVTLVRGGTHDKANLRVIERCNLHGLWETTKEIAITQ
ncbi:MAG: superoxide reductase [Nitrospirae bacterium]|nr:superoxide reductase [Nitrospirota bacterium]